METRWTVNDNYVLRTIGGESVLVQIGDAPDPRLDNAMISMNETGAFLWNLFLGTPMTEDEAVQAAEAAFSAPDGVIKTHIHAFVKEFSEIGLLIKED